MLCVGGGKMKTDCRIYKSVLNSIEHFISTVLVWMGFDVGVILWWWAASFIYIFFPVRMILWWLVQWERIGQMWYRFIQCTVIRTMRTLSTVGKFISKQMISCTLLIYIIYVFLFHESASTSLKQHHRLVCGNNLHVCQSVEKKGATLDVWRFYSFLIKIK